MENDFPRKRGRLRGNASGGIPPHPDCEAVWNIIFLRVNPERSEPKGRVD